MKKQWIVLGMLVFLPLLPNSSRADQNQSHSNGFEDDLWRRDTLTDGFFGFNDAMAGSGIEAGLSLTQIYQQNVRGGISKHRKAGRYTGSYDLELNADLEKLLGIQRAGLYMHIEGGWSGGIDVSSVSSAFGVNGDAGGDEVIFVSELWYEQALFGDCVRIRIGKLDLTGGFEHRGCPVAFDCSGYANDETSQFLNSALINNPTIPFPDRGLAAVIHYGPTEGWYASAGIADAQADARETGFNTTFGDEDYFFSIFETGFTPQLDSANGPLQGAYRAGLWYDPQPKAGSDYADAGKSYRDDVGFYLSCDQMLVKESADLQDSQGLGAFFRYGYSDSKRNDITDFFSLGIQYQGLIEDRDEDVLGVGFAHGTFSDKASSSYTNDYESIIELYYNAQLTAWLNISPSIQYVANPGGIRGVSDAVILGTRIQMLF